MRSARSLAVLTLLPVLCTSTLALAQKKAEPAKPSGKARVDLDLPKFDAIPKADLEKPKDEKVLGTEPKANTTTVTYNVVKVMHAKSFSKSGGLSSPNGALAEIGRSGTPP